MAGDAAKPRGGLRSHKTKIVATVGPASSSPAVITDLIRAGVDVVRLNFSHGKPEEHRVGIERVREAARVVGRDVAILADLPGPKIRLGAVADGGAILRAGARFVLTAEDVVGDGTRASVSFAELPRVVKRGDRLYLNDGLVRLEVEAVDGDEVRCVVVTGGPIASRKGVNLPGLDLGVAAFTEQDQRCLAFALAHGVDAVSQSFVESAADVRQVRRAARALGGDPIVIAKIERARALDRVDEILAAADGLMIARGDLGVEVPIERIALLQKELIAMAMAAGKPVITATQMLESMTHSPQPTRAEATDVANAILDGTDGVMLSAESATGEYPVEAVATLARIAAAVEPHRARGRVDRSTAMARTMGGGDAGVPLVDVASAAVEAALAGGGAAAVIAPTGSGSTARRLARHRLPVWIVAVCPSVAVGRQLQLSYGVHAMVLEDPDVDWTVFARRWVGSHGLAGSFAVIARGPSAATPKANHVIEVVALEAAGSGEPPDCAADAIG